VEAAFQHRANSDPNLTQEKLALWINHEIPLEIESFGFNPKANASASAPGTGSSNAPADDKVAALEKRLAAAEAALQNNTTADVRSRNRNLPSVSGRDSGNQPSGSDATIPAAALASKDAFLKFIRS
jgi:hypothetical protein